MDGGAPGAVAAARVARGAGHLRVAMRALDEGWRGLDPHTPEARELASEGMVLARDLIARNARVAALGELLRAAPSLGGGASDALSALIQAYPTFRPRPEAIGVPKDGLKAGATGAFWVDHQLRGRILVLAGGITGEGTEAFQRALERSAEGIEWLLVDVAQLSYVGSSGLAQVVKVAENLGDRRGGMSLFSPSSSLKILVEMLGVERFLNPLPGLTEAVERVRQGPGRKHSGRH